MIRPASGQPPVERPDITPRIRPMTRRHLTAVTAIEADRNRDPWSRQLFAGEIDRLGDDRHWLVAVATRRVVGFAGILFAAGDAHVMNLAVAEGWTRRGIALDLCRELLAEAADRGMVAATLEVRAANTGAIALYHRLGFTAAGTRPRYYADGEDAVIMWLHDLTPFRTPAPR